MAPAEPKPGDLIEIFRLGYAHWALYVGNGYVVHVAPPGDITGAALANIMSSGSGRAIVKKELLSKVAGKDMYRVNNKHDRKHSPRPLSEILQRAAEQVGKELPYKLTSDNCEHFVNELRYGVHCSNQVTKVVCATLGTVSMITFGMAVGIPAGMAAGILGVCLTITGLNRAMQN